ncbi:unnamed protein product, partial [Rotaria magnacalcarata]
FKMKWYEPIRWITASIPPTTIVPISAAITIKKRRCAVKNPRWTLN